MYQPAWLMKVRRLWSYDLTALYKSIIIIVIIIIIIIIIIINVFLKRCALAPR